MLTIAITVVLSFGIGLIVRSNNDSTALARPNEITNQQNAAPPPTIAPPPTAAAVVPLSNAPELDAAPVPAQAKGQQVLLYRSQADLKVLDEFTLVTVAPIPVDEPRWQITRGLLYEGGLGATSGAPSFNTAALGDLTWSNMRYSAAVRASTGNRMIGITFRRIDANNFYAFVLRPRQNETSNVALYKWVNGQPELLMKGKVATIRSDQWYTLEVAVTGSHLVGSVDGVEVLTSDDTTYATGNVGVLATNEASTAFGEFLVLPQ